MVKIVKMNDAPEWATRGRNAKYDFRSMAVGALMTIPVDECGCKNIKSFRALVWNRARQLGYDLICRVNENGDYEVFRKE